MSVHLEQYYKELSAKDRKLVLEKFEELWSDKNFSLKMYWALCFLLMVNEDVFEHSNIGIR